jgi:hypothetical protein
MSATTNAKAKATATTKHTTFEDKIRQYAALFDGSEKDFSVVEAMFNNLYHDDFIGTDSNGEEINKETKKQLDEKRLAAGAKVRNFAVAYTRIDYNKALVEFYSENEGKSVISQYLVTIKDKKIIEARQVDRLAGIIKAWYLSGYHSIRRIQSYQHEGKVIFEGQKSPFAAGNKVH